MACPHRLRRARVRVCHHGWPCRVGGVRTGGQTTGAKGALLTLLSQPFGFALLGLVAFGLLCLSGWRLAQSILDADRLGTEGKALVRRIGYGVSAVVHAGLAFFAVSVVFGLKAASGSDEQSARDWTAYLLTAPLGRWLIGAVGLTMILIAGSKGATSHLIIVSSSCRL